MKKITKAQDSSSCAFSSIDDHSRSSSGQARRLSIVEQEAALILGKEEFERSIGEMIDITEISPASAAQLPGAKLTSAADEHQN